MSNNQIPRSHNWVYYKNSFYTSMTIISVRVHGKELNVPTLQAQPTIDSWAVYSLQSQFRSDWILAIKL